MNKANFKKNIIIRDEKEYHLIYDSKTLLAYPCDFNPLEILKKYNNGDRQLQSTINSLAKMDLLEGKVNDNSVPCNTKIPFLNKTTFDELRSPVSPLSLLWATTPVCNLRCIYCYPNAPDFNKETHSLFDHQRTIQIAKNIARLKIIRVTLSGGESLLNPSIWKIIDILNHAKLNLFLLTNGTVINRKNAKKIKERGISCSVSIDSVSEKINAITRGPNILEKVLSGIEILRKNDIHTNINVTLTRYNYDYIEEIFEFVINKGLQSVYLQDLMPFSDLSIYNSLKLTFDQEKNLFEKLENIKKKYGSLLAGTGELQVFHKKCNPHPGIVMDCPSGDHFAYLNFDGNLYPCSNLLNAQYCLGNVYSDPIEHLWQHSANIKKLRAQKNEPLSQLPICNECKLNQQCSRGCRGDALSTTGDFYGLPSRCPKRLSEENINRNRCSNDGAKNRDMSQPQHHVLK